MAAHSIESRIEQTGGRSSGFDYLRIFLAVGIIGWHTVLVCYGRAPNLEVWHSPLRPVVAFLVPSFFALSGFLVAGSLFRNSVLDFLTLRALRILPALCCEVVISALIIGPAVTSLPLSEYFTDRGFYAYFLNIAGIVHYELPGAFSGLPNEGVVNLQLWTIPYELECYIALTLLALLGVVTRPRLLVPAVWLLAIFVVTDGLFLHLLPVSGFAAFGRLALLGFLFGVVLYVERARTKLSLPFFAASAALAWTLLSYPEFQYLAALPVAYVTVWLGLQDPPKIFLVRGVDYSYGMYLYGFPIQQTVAYAFPEYRVWYFNLALALAFAAFCAFVSWNAIERPVQENRKRVIGLVRGAVERVRQLGTASPFRGPRRRAATRPVRPS